MPWDRMPTDFETVTKTEVFSLEGLIAWLRTQPANKTYDYYNCGGACLAGQYLAARGEPYGAGKYKRVFGPMTEDGGNGYGMIASREPFTMGDALTRAEIYQERGWTSKEEVAEIIAFRVEGGVKRWLRVLHRRVAASAFAACSP